jgi:hypothetical protein
MNEKIKLEFNTSLYALEAVQKSVQDYKECANFVIETTPTLILVVVDQIDPELQDVLVDAFCNHVLNETILFRRVSLGGMI